MSTWRICLRALYEHGRGPYRMADFDTLDMPITAFQGGVRACVRRGHMMAHPGENGYVRDYMYSITPLGLDVIEGRAGVVSGWCGKFRTARNWLASLPATNQVRITSHLRDWAP